MSPTAAPDRGLRVRLLAEGILALVDERDAHATALLESREADLEDRRDRALLHEIVLGVLRQKPAIDRALAQLSTRPLDSIDPTVLRALRIGVHSLLFLDRVPDFAAVDTAVRLVKSRGAAKAAGFVNGILRRAVRDPAALACPEPSDGDVPGLGRVTGHPLWWTVRVVERLGWEAAREMLRANARPAPTVVRTVRGIPRERVRARLASEGVEAVPCRFSSTALRIVRGVPQSTETFREGLVYIQDEASQLVAALFGEQPGRRVADLCAAPGGKTLQLAEALPPGESVLAVDRSERRLRRLLDNASRLGLRQQVAALCADVESALPLAAGAFDHVLLDAPCSGTGTMRRHPEIRWRLRPDDLRRLARVQARMLAAAAERVAPGGILVYSVCSMEPEEGPGVVGEFLASCGDFAREDVAPSLPEAARILVAADGTLRTSPVVDGLDGFYAARLRRAP